MTDIIDRQKRKAKFVEESKERREREVKGWAKAYPLKVINAVAKTVNNCRI